MPTAPDYGPAADPVDTVRIPDLGTLDPAAAPAFDASLSEIRRHLHANPEVGFQEFNTSRFIAGLLRRANLDVRAPIAGTGVFVDIIGKSDGPVVAYRADIDALPATDEKNVPYSSTVAGAAHLCGHDAHTTVAIAVALILDRMRDALDGTVRVFFQPNEEGVPAGAPEMIRAGILDRVDSVYACHVDPTLPVGTIGLIKGAATAAADRFEVTLSSSGGHSARPHDTTDTVWVATLIAQQLYQLSTRITDARNPAVLAICRFQAGTATNVIPPVASFAGTLRCTNESDRSTLKKRIIDIAHTVGSLHGAAVDVTYLDGAPPVLNHPDLVDGIARVAASVADSPTVRWIPAPSMGAEDFAYYQQAVPGALVRLGTASSPENAYPLHHPLFDIDEGAMLPAARFMALVLADRLAQLRRGGVGDR